MRLILMGKVSQEKQGTGMRMRTFWIENDQDKNVEFCFVKTLKAGAHTEINIVAKDIYNIFVNGQFVHYGPARVAKGYARVDKLTLDAYLTKQENELCVFVQANRTRNLFTALENPLFGAEVYVNGELLCDGGAFECYKMTDKVRKVERMSSQRGYVEIYHAAKNRIDGILSGCFPKVELCEVPAPIFLERNVGYAKNEEDFAAFYEKGSVLIDDTKTWRIDFVDLLDGVGRFEGKLDGFLRKDCDEVVSRRLASFVFEKDGKEGAYLYQNFALDRTRTGKFVVKLKVPTATELFLLYDDFLVDGVLQFNREQIIHALKWHLDAGEYTLYSGEVYVAKFVSLVSSSAIDVESVSMLCIENDETDDFSISCKDKTLQEITLSALHSFEQNGYDLLTDCPSRERAGYLCDGYFAAIAERMYTGANKVEGNMLENYALYKNEHFKSDGILPMCYPSEPDDDQTYIPNWVLWYVVELADRKKRCGQELSPAEQIKVRAVVDYFASKENEYGLLENLEGWVFLEWSKAGDFMEDVNFPSNILYSAALKGAGELLGDHTLLEKASALKTTILKMAFNGTFFADNAVRVDGKLVVQGNYSETCQYFAAYFDILTRAENPDFYRRIVEGFGPMRKTDAYQDMPKCNMFMGYVLRLCLLDRLLEHRLLLDECRETFASMAEATGTIWELFATNASCNHGFGSIVGALIVKALTGLVDIDETAKVLTFTQDTVKMDVKITFSLSGEVTKITIQDGVRGVCLPTGYTVTVLDV